MDIAHFVWITCFHNTLSENRILLQRQLGHFKWKIHVTATHILNTWISERNIYIAEIALHTSCITGINPPTFLNLTSKTVDQFNVQGIQSAIRITEVFACNPSSLCQTNLIHLPFTGRRPTNHIGFNLTDITMLVSGDEHTNIFLLRHIAFQSSMTGHSGFI